ncbi:MAG: transposase [Ignavibacteriota bacterium]
MKKEVVKYDEQFKRVVVDMLESGEINSIEEARRVFKIGGSSIITKWIKKLGKEDILPKIKLRKLIDEVDSIEDKNMYEKVLIRLGTVEDRVNNFSIDTKM